MALVLLPCSVRRCYVFPSQHFSCLQFLPAVCRSRSWRLPVPVPIVMASFRLGCQFVIPSGAPVDSAGASFPAPSSTRFRVCSRLMAGAPLLVFLFPDVRSDT